MLPNIEHIKGVHPGIILGRELQKRSHPKNRFAESVNEFPQTIGAIIAGRRRMNPALSIKIEEMLGAQEGYFMVLQAYYDIKIERQKNKTTPDLTKLRPALFWDTNMQTIDWQQYKASIIRRVFERGNEQEQAEITRFYSQSTIDQIVQGDTLRGYTLHNPVIQ